MSDRFKFRVWDKKNNLYFGCDYPPRWYNVDELYGDIDEIFIEGMYKIANDDDYVLEQCTGLKDKNGKLIYEGDILKICSNTDREVISLVVWDDEETGFCVKYKEELFRFNTYREYHKLEIIGNIHETPELLKESK